MRSLPLAVPVSLLVALLPQLASTSPAPSPSDLDYAQSPNYIAPGYSPYAAFPHSPRQIGSAFLPPSSSSPNSSSSSSSSPSFFPSPLQPTDPSTATNPAPRRRAPEWAWHRHPLYTPGKGDDEQQASRFKTREYNYTRTRERGLAWAQHLPGGNDELEKRKVVSSVEVDFPPSAWIDINDLSTLALLAQAAVARMQTWYEDGVFEWTGWWQTPVLGIAYTNLDLALGNRVNELLIKDLLIRNDDLGWMIDKYIDDQSWWAMFALRAHQAYPNATWLEMVETINTNNTLYWSNTCGGGVLWLTYRPMIKNTITNGLYFSILTRLYRYTSNSTHFDYAMNTLNWWLSWAFDADNGRVSDTITAQWEGQEQSGCTVTGEQTWTYNSGAFLFGLADLYYATGDEGVLDLGRTIAYAAMRDYVPDEATGILVEGCEDDPPPGEGKPPGCQQDETVFKGIFLLGLSELYVARPDPNIYNFINTQLLSNVFNNVDDSWLFGMWWGGPWNETTAGPKTQINFLCLLAAAATVNADYLSRISSSSSNASEASVASEGMRVASETDQIGVPESTATGDAGTGRDGASSGGTLTSGARRRAALLRRRGRARGRGTEEGVGGKTLAVAATLAALVGAGVGVLWV
ncbi:hypothetical protein JCM8097_004394 [Rhodosporidiobolus ruineniae]